MSIRDQMPLMLAHEGTWKGTYRHLSLSGELEDMHEATVRCEFPPEGKHAYIQHNHFIWADGREQKATLPGVLRDGKLWWDTDTFHGCAWESDGVILLHLHRKDEPGAYFVEIIVMGESGKDRARTWHWFKDGKLYRRTLCDEKKIA
jgi:hypothetical protein